MKTLCRWVLAVVAVGASVGGVPAFAQVSPYQTSSPEAATTRVRRLIGMSVENRDGIKLGAVKDFAVDLESGRVDYAILATPGLLGLHAQLSVVPPPALSSATVKKRTVALDISMARWRDAPRFKRKDLQSLSLRTREVQIYEFYGLPVPGPKPARRGVPRAEGKLLFATGLIGRTISGRDGESIGRISDLLVDPAGSRPALALITGLEALPGRRIYAVPLRMLSQPTPDQILVNVTRGAFERAHPFTLNAWQTASGGGDAVFRYE